MGKSRKSMVGNLFRDLGMAGGVQAARTLGAGCEAMQLRDCSMRSL